MADNISSFTTIKRAPPQGAHSTEKTEIFIMLAELAEKLFLFFLGLGGFFVLATSIVAFIETVN